MIIIVISFIIGVIVGIILTLKVLSVLGRIGAGMVEKKEFEKWQKD